MGILNTPKKTLGREKTKKAIKDTIANVKSIFKK